MGHVDLSFRNARTLLPSGSSWLSPDPVSLLLPQVAEEEIAKRALAAIEPHHNDSSAVMHLRAENSRLRSQLKYAWKQVAEMKAFLNDYGMVWVGEPEAEAQLMAHGYTSSSGAAGSARTSINGAAAVSMPPPGTVVGPGSHGGQQLRPLPPPEAAEAPAPRRRSHTGGPAAHGAGPSAGASGTAGPSGSGGAAAAGSASTGKPPQPVASSASAAAGGSAAADKARSKSAGVPASLAAAGPGRPAEGAANSPTGTSASTSAAAAAPTTSASAAEALSKRSTSYATLPVGASPGPGPARPGSLAPLQGLPNSSPLPPLSHPAARPPLPVPLSELQSKVDELNEVAGDGCGQIVSAGGGQHVLSTPDPVNLVVYRDGLQIHTMPAKPYNDPAVTAVLRDILDGYFPYVLKRDFPDGVPLRVVDRTGDTIDSSPMRRQGAGAAGGAGGAGAAGAGVRASNIRTFDDIDTQGGAGEPVGREQFLSRLPQAVIKKGKVIDIRADISKMLGGGAGGAGAGGGGAKPEVSLVPTPVDALLSTIQRNHVGPSLPPPSREGQVNVAQEVTTLQVKSFDGKQTYIVKLKYDDNIGELRKCINQHLKGSGGGQKPGAYEIRSAFPARAYTDEVETLRQAGLIPNATLFLRVLPA